MSKISTSINNYKPDFRKEYKAPDFRTGYVVPDFRTESNSHTSKKQPNYFPQQSPILSTEYIGIGSEKWKVSSDKFSSCSEIWHEGSDIIKHSSEIFTSSEDILRYLKEHPDFQKMPPSQLEAILAAIISGLLAIGGVALAIVSGGAATPGVILGTSLLIGTGVTGMQNAISGAIKKKFQLG